MASNTVRGGTILQQHQQRVVDEKTELDTKLAKLLTFLDGAIFKSLDPDEQGRLTIQAGVMDKYSEILGQRIAAF